MGARFVWINVLVGGLFAVAVDAKQRLISVSTSLTSASISATSVRRQMRQYREGTSIVAR
jgi:hypothetical protein